MDNPQLRFLLKFEFTYSGIMDNVAPVNSGVYALRHLPSNKFYVGMSTNLRTRLFSHLGATSIGNYEFIDPKDWDVLILEMGVGIPKARLWNKEAYWSYYYDSHSNGYNKTKDGSGFDSNKGRIWVNDGKENFRIFESDLSHYPDLKVGFLGTNLKGKINITKEGIDKRVDATVITDFLDCGWEYGKEFLSGRLPDGYKGYDPKRHKTYMHKGKEEIYITDTWYHFWKDQGYVCGRFNSIYPTVTDGNEEVSIYEYEVEEYLKKGFKKQYLVEFYDAKECLIYDEELLPQNKEKWIWMNKFGYETNTLEVNENTFIADGWSRGRCMTIARTADGRYEPDRHKVTVTDGTTEYPIVHYYLPYWLSIGYRIGRLDGKLYFSNGVDELILPAGTPCPDGYENKSLAEFHIDEINTGYKLWVLDQQK